MEILFHIFIGLSLQAVLTNQQYTGRGIDKSSVINLSSLYQSLINGNFAKSPAIPATTPAIPQLTAIPQYVMNRNQPSVYSSPNNAYPHAYQYPQEQILDEMYYSKPCYDPVRELYKKINRLDQRIGQLFGGGGSASSRLQLKPSDEQSMKYERMRVLPQSEDIENEDYTQKGEQFRNETLFKGPMKRHAKPKYDRRSGNGQQRNKDLHSGEVEILTAESLEENRNEDYQKEENTEKDSSLYDTLSTQGTVKRPLKQVELPKTLKDQDDTHEHEVFSTDDDQPSSKANKRISNKNRRIHRKRKRRPRRKGSRKSKTPITDPQSGKNQESKQMEEKVPITMNKNQKQRKYETYIPSKTGSSISSNKNKSEMSNKRKKLLNERQHRRNRKQKKKDIFKTPHLVDEDDKSTIESIEEANKNSKAEGNTSQKEEELVEKIKGERELAQNDPSISTRDDEALKDGFNISLEDFMKEITHMDKNKPCIECLPIETPQTLESTDGFNTDNADIEKIELKAKKVRIKNDAKEENDKIDVGSRIFLGNSEVNIQKYKYNSDLREENKTNKENGENKDFIENIFTHIVKDENIKRLEDDKISNTTIKEEGIIDNKSTEDAKLKEETLSDIFGDDEITILEDSETTSINIGMAKNGDARSESSNGISLNISHEITKNNDNKPEIGKEVTINKEEENKDLVKKTTPHILEDDNVKIQEDGETLRSPVDKERTNKIKQNKEIIKEASCDIPGEDEVKILGYGETTSRCLNRTKNEGTQYDSVSEISLGASPEITQNYYYKPEICREVIVNKEARSRELIEETISPILADDNIEILENSKMSHPPLDEDKIFVEKKIQEGEGNIEKTLLGDNEVNISGDSETRSLPGGIAKNEVSLSESENGTSISNSHEIIQKNYNKPEIIEKGIVNKLEKKNKDFAQETIPQSLEDDNVTINNHDETSRLVVDKEKTIAEKKIEQGEGIIEGTISEIPGDGVAKILEGAENISRFVDIAVNEETQSGDEGETSLDTPNEMSHNNDNKPEIRLEVIFNRETGKKDLEDKMTLTILGVDRVELLKDGKISHPTLNVDKIFTEKKIEQGKGSIEEIMSDTLGDDEVKISGDSETTSLPVDIAKNEDTQSNSESGMTLNSSHEIIQKNDNMPEIIDKVIVNKAEKENKDFTQEMIPHALKDDNVKILDNSETPRPIVNEEGNIIEKKIEIDREKVVETLSDLGNNEAKILEDKETMNSHTDIANREETQSKGGSEISLGTSDEITHNNDNNPEIREEVIVNKEVRNKHLIKETIPHVLKNDNVKILQDDETLCPHKEKNEMIIGKDRRKKVEQGKVITEETISDLLGDDLVKLLGDSETRNNTRDVAENDNTHFNSGSEISLITSHEIIRNNDINPEIDEEVFVNKEKEIEDIVEGTISPILKDNNAQILKDAKISHPPLDEDAIVLGKEIQQENEIIEENLSHLLGDDELKILVDSGTMNQPVDVSENEDTESNSRNGTPLSTSHVKTQNKDIRPEINEEVIDNKAEKENKDSVEKATLILEDDNEKIRDNGETSHPIVGEDTIIVEKKIEQESEILENSLPGILGNNKVKLLEDRETISLPVDIAKNEETQSENESEISLGTSEKTTHNNDSKPEIREEVIVNIQAENKNLIKKKIPNVLKENNVKILQDSEPSRPVQEKNKNTIEKNIEQGKVITEEVIVNEAEKENKDSVEETTLILEDDNEKIQDNGQTSCPIVSEGTIIVEKEIEQDSEIRENILPGILGDNEAKLLEDKETISLPIDIEKNEETQSENESYIPLDTSEKITHNNDSKPEIREVIVKIQAENKNLIKRKISNVLTENNVKILQDSEPSSPAKEENENTIEENTEQGKVITEETLSDTLRNDLVKTPRDSETTSLPVDIAKNEGTQTNSEIGITISPSHEITQNIGNTLKIIDDIIINKSEKENEDFVHETIPYVLEDNNIKIENDDDTLRSIVDEEGNIFEKKIEKEEGMKEETLSKILEKDKANILGDNDNMNYPVDVAVNGETQPERGSEISLGNEITHNNDNKPEIPEDFTVNEEMGKNYLVEETTPYILKKDNSETSHPLVNEYEVVVKKKIEQSKGSIEHTLSGLLGGDEIKLLGETVKEVKNEDAQSYSESGITLSNSHEITQKNDKKLEIIDEVVVNKTEIGNTDFVQERITHILEDGNVKIQNNSEISPPILDEGGNIFEKKIKQYRGILEEMLTYTVGDNEPKVLNGKETMSFPVDIAKDEETRSEGVSEISLATSDEIIYDNDYKPEICQEVIVNTEVGNKKFIKEKIPRILEADKVKIQRDGEPPRPHKEENEIVIDNNIEQGKINTEETLSDLLENDLVNISGDSETMRNTIDVAKNEDKHSNSGREISLSTSHEIIKKNDINPEIHEEVTVNKERENNDLVEEMISPILKDDYVEILKYAKTSQHTVDNDEIGVEKNMEQSKESTEETSSGLLGDDEVKILGERVVKNEDTQFNSESEITLSDFHEIEQKSDKSNIVGVKFNEAKKENKNFVEKTTPYILEDANATIQNNTDTSRPIADGEDNIYEKKIVQDEEIIEETISEIQEADEAKILEDKENMSCTIDVAVNGEMQSGSRYEIPLGTSNEIIHNTDNQPKNPEEVILYKEAGKIYLLEETTPSILENDNVETLEDCKTSHPPLNQDEIGVEKKIEKSKGSKEETLSDLLRDDLVKRTGDTETMSHTIEEAKKGDAQSNDGSGIFLNISHEITDNNDIKTETHEEVIVNKEKVINDLIEEMVSPNLKDDNVELLEARNASHSAIDKDEIVTEKKIKQGKGSTEESLFDLLGDYEVKTSGDTENMSLPVDVAENEDKQWNSQSTFYEITQKNGNIPEITEEVIVNKAEKENEDFVQEPITHILEDDNVEIQDNGVISRSSVTEEGSIFEKKIKQDSGILEETLSDMLGDNEARILNDRETDHFEGESEISLGSFGEITDTNDYKPEIRQEVIINIEAGNKKLIKKTIPHISEADKNEIIVSNETEKGKIITEDTLSDLLGNNLIKMSGDSEIKSHNVDVAKNEDKQSNNASEISISTSHEIVEKNDIKREIDEEIFINREKDNKDLVEELISPILKHEHVEILKDSKTSQHTVDKDEIGVEKNTEKDKESTEETSSGLLGDDEVNILGERVDAVKNEDTQFNSESGKTLSDFHEIAQKSGNKSNVVVNVMVNEAEKEKKNAVEETIPYILEDDNVTIQNNTDISRSKVDGEGNVFEKKIEQGENIIEENISKIQGDNEAKILGDSENMSCPVDVAVTGEIQSESRCEISLGTSNEIIYNNDDKLEIHQEVIFYKEAGKTYLGQETIPPILGDDNVETPEDGMTSYPPVNEDEIGVVNKIGKAGRKEETSVDLLGDDTSFDLLGDDIVKRTGDIETKNHTIEGARKEDVQFNNGSWIFLNMSHEITENNDSKPEIHEEVIVNKEKGIKDLVEATISPILKRDIVETLEDAKLSQPVVADDKIGVGEKLEQGTGSVEDISSDLLRDDEVKISEYSATTSLPVDVSKYEDNGSGIHISTLYEITQKNDNNPGIIEKIANKEEKENKYYVEETIPRVFENGNPKIQDDGEISHPPIDEDEIVVKEKIEQGQEIIKDTLHDVLGEGEAKTLEDSKTTSLLIDEAKNQDTQSYSGSEVSLNTTHEIIQNSYNKSEFNEEFIFNEKVNNNFVKDTTPPISENDDVAILENGKIARHPEDEIFVKKRIQQSEGIIEGTLSDLLADDEIKISGDTTTVNLSVNIARNQDTQSNNGRGISSDTYYEIIHKKDNKAELIDETIDKKSQEENKEMVEEMIPHILEDNYVKILDDGEKSRSIVDAEEITTEKKMEQDKGIIKAALFDVLRDEKIKILRDSEKARQNFFVDKTKNKDRHSDSDSGISLSTSYEIMQNNDNGPEINEEFIVNKETKNKDLVEKAIPTITEGDNVEISKHGKISRPIVSKEKENGQIDSEIGIFLGTFNEIPQKGDDSNLDFIDKIMVNKKRGENKDFINETVFDILENNNLTIQGGDEISNPFVAKEEKLSGHLEIPKKDDHTLALEKGLGRISLEKSSEKEDISLNLTEKVNLNEGIIVDIPKHQSESMQSQKNNYTLKPDDVNIDAYYLKRERKRPHQYMTLSNDSQISSQRKDNESSQKNDSLKPKDTLKELETDNNKVIDEKIEKGAIFSKPSLKFFEVTNPPEKLLKGKEIILDDNEKSSISFAKVDDTVNTVEVMDLSVKKNYLNDSITNVKLHSEKVQSQKHNNSSKPDDANCDMHYSHNNRQISPKFMNILNQNESAYENDDHSQYHDSLKAEDMLKEVNLQNNMENEIKNGRSYEFSEPFVKYSEADDLEPNLNVSKEELSNMKEKLQDSFRQKETPTLSIHRSDQGNATSKEMGWTSVSPLIYILSISFAIVSLILAWNLILKMFA